MAVQGVSNDPVVGKNLARLEQIFLKRTDPNYKAVKDGRYEDYPNAVVAQGVKISEKGAILPPVVSSDRKVLVMVDLSFIPGEPDPLQVLPSELECRERPFNRDERGIMATADTALGKYPALFMAADLFNNQGKLDEMRQAS